MDGIVGQSLVRQLTLIRAGAPQLAAMVTYSLVGPTGAALLTAGFTTEWVGGVYTVTLDGGDLTTVGSYLETWDVAVGSDEYPVSGRFRLGHAVPGMLPRWALRHDVADRLTDLWLGQAASADATHLTDPLRVEPDWRGAYLSLYGGTGRGQERIVSANNSTTGALTVPTWTTTPDATSRYELHRTYRAAQYNAAINQAVRALSPYVPLPVEEISITQTTATDYPVPAGLRALTRVESGNATDGYARLDRARQQWSTRPGSQQVVLAASTPGDTLRLGGVMFAEPLAHDDAWCVLDTEYVACQAAGELLLGAGTGPQTDPDARIQKAQLFLGRAQDRQQRVRRAMPAGAVPI